MLYRRVSSLCTIDMCMHKRFSFFIMIIFNNINTLYRFFIMVCNGVLWPAGLGWVLSMLKLGSIFTIAFRYWKYFYSQPGQPGQSYEYVMSLPGIIYIILHFSISKILLFLLTLPVCLLGLLALLMYWTAC